jgi:hypothetical protein
LQHLGKGCNFLRKSGLPGGIGVASGSGTKSRRLPLKSQEVSRMIFRVHSELSEHRIIPGIPGRSYPVSRISFDRVKSIDSYFRAIDLIITSKVLSEPKIVLAGSEHELKAPGT